MLLQIKHITEYTYSNAVFFEPHQLRFKPRNTPYSSLKEFTIKIEPEPAGLSEQIDIENNLNSVCWFDDKYSRLKISSRSVVEITEFNPFNFLVYPPEFISIPFEYERNQKELLHLSLQTNGVSDAMLDYLNKILDKSDNHTINFLANITKEIHKEFSVKSREKGEPYQPSFTFKEKEGSCRDLAWMQIHMLRQLGIASRFVSGYYYIDHADPEFELHAWVESYVPGAGWIGLDPGHGILADSYHIPVASSAYYENTMPVSGMVRGKATSALRNELKISQVIKQ